MQETEEETDKRLERKAILVQVYYCIIANLTNIAPGMSLTYAAVTLPAFRNENEPFHVTLEEATWIVSLASISNPIGCLLAGPLADRLGRKLSLLLINIPSFIGFVLIAFATDPYNLEMVYAGRITTGLALGLASTPTTIFMSEISMDRQRGMFISWASVAISTGMICCYGLGAAFPTDWRIIAQICLVFPIVTSIIGYIILPESPSWLLLKGKTKEAEMNFKKIRGISPTNELPTIFKEEYDKIIKHIENKSQEKYGVREIWREFQKPSGWKPYIIMNCFFIFQQFSGVYVIIGYAVDVVQQFGVEFNPYYIALMIGFSRLIVTLIFGFVSMHLGRRKPVIVSGVGMVVLIGCLTLYSYLIANDVISGGGLSWVPIVLLILLICTSTMGFLTLPWTMLAEVYPIKIRGLASGLTTCFGNILSFVALKMYPILVEDYGTYNVFLGFTVVTILGIIYVYLFLPETQGKSFAEIEASFYKKKNNKRGRNSPDLIHGRDNSAFQLDDFSKS